MWQSLVTAPNHSYPRGLNAQNVAILAAAVISAPKG